MKQDDPISRRFWFDHESGTRLYPCRIRDRGNKTATFRVVPRGTGNNSELQLQDEEELYERVIMQGWAVRMSSLDHSQTGLFHKEAASIVRTSRA